MDFTKIGDKYPEKGKTILIHGVDGKYYIGTFYVSSTNHPCFCYSDNTCDVACDEDEWIEFDKVLPLINSSAMKEHDDALINKACNWMEGYFPPELDGYGFEFVSRSEVIDDFRDAMSKS